MKRFLYLLYVLFAVALWGALGYYFAGVEGMMLGAIGPTTLTDSGIMKQWRRLSRDAFWLSQLKVAFAGPGWSGTNKSRRRIETREDILGPPFLEYWDLDRLQGDRLTDTVHVPPFDGDDEVLFGTGDYEGYQRVKGQNRVNFEFQGSRKNIDFALQSRFSAAFEEDPNMSEQELGGQLLPILIEHLSNNESQYQDADKLFSFFLVYSPHVYARIAQADSTISDEDPVAGQSNLGVPAPYEHPNTFAWINQGSLADPNYKLISAADIADATSADGATATSWSGKVHETVSQIDSSALPGIQLLDQIMLEITNLRIVPIRFITQDGEMESCYYLLVGPAMMNMFFADPGLQKRFGDAYNGWAYKHPLINEKDKVYRKFIIKEIEKLNQDLYTYKYQYGDTYDYGVTAEGGHDGRTGLDSGNDADTVKFRKKTTTGTGRDLRTFIEPQQRTFRRFISAGDNNAAEASATSAGNDDAIGVDGGDKLDRMVMLGASAHGAVPGPVFPMDRRQEDDYGSKIGIGQERLQACRRIDFPTSRDHASGYDNQGSLVIAAYNGK